MFPTWILRREVEDVEGHRLKIKLTSGCRSPAWTRRSGDQVARISTADNVTTGLLKGSCATGFQWSASKCFRPVAFRLRMCFWLSCFSTEHAEFLRSEVCKSGRLPCSIAGACHDFRENRQTVRPLNWLSRLFCNTRHSSQQNDFG